MFKQLISVLGEAWRQVKANHGAPGVDGTSIETIVSSGQEGEMIQRLSRALREKTYRFRPVRRVDIPKPKGGTRPLGIATVEDRVVQTAMKLILEPICEADFHDCSYGYRPKRDAKQASIAIREDLYQRAWGVVEIDVQSYCTTIPHDKLLVLIRQRVVDGSMLWIIKQSLTVGVAFHGRIEPTTIGVPQGSPISPLYSTIYLNLLDQVWHKRRYPEQLGATLHRFADDAILVCRKDGRQALEAFEAIASRMGLIVNREKTRSTKLTDGFEFLGFQFVKRRSPTSGKSTIYLFPSTTAQRRVRQQIKAFTKRRAPVSPDAFVQRLNHTVRGWANYYRHTTPVRRFAAYNNSSTPACAATSPIAGKAGGLDGSSFQTRPCMPRGSSTLAAGISGARKLLCMLCDEDCRTAVLGRTERPVGWEGDGEPTMSEQVRHCHGETRSNG